MSNSEPTAPKLTPEQKHKAHVKAAHTANLDRLKPIQAARAKASKAFPSAEPVHTDAKGNIVQKPRANTVHVPAQTPLVHTAKGETISASSPEGKKLLAKQGAASLKMKASLLADAKKKAAL